MEIVYYSAQKINQRVAQIEDMQRAKIFHTIPVILLKKRLQIELAEHALLPRTELSLP